MWFKRKYFSWLVILWLGVSWYFPLPAFAQTEPCIPENDYKNFAFGGSCADTLCCPGLDCVTIETQSPNSLVSIPVGMCLKAAHPQGTYETTVPAYEVRFVPQITIPGSTFTQGQPVKVTGETLGQYLAIFYRFFVMAIAVMAVVMVMWGGFKRIYAAGSPEKIKDANDTIVSAISGLAIALLSYTLLNLVNPKLTEFESLEIKAVVREELDWNPEPQLVAQAKPTTLSIILPSSDVIIGPETLGQLDLTAAEAVNRVIAALRDRGYGMYITDGYRSPEEQKRLIEQNCQNPPGSDKCNPYAGKPVTCTMRNGPYSCPHSTGYALDIWATKDDNVCIKDILPKDNKLSGFCYGKGHEECLKNECQAALIQEMKKEGFCNLCSEPWHFEYIRGDYKGAPGCTC